MNILIFSQRKIDQMSTTPPQHTFRDATDGPPGTTQSSLETQSDGGPVAPVSSKPSQPNEIEGQLRLECVT